MLYKKELEKAGASMIRRRHKISIAESVTAGLIQNAFANILNSSSFFEGGITAYNLHQKCTHLFVDPVIAIQCNCVSETVANQMALGVSKSFKTNWGIAITGYAAPVPELGLEDLYACYSISFGDKILRSVTMTAITESPEEVQHFYMISVLEDFIQCCTDFDQEAMT